MDLLFRSTWLALSPEQFYFSQRKYFPLGNMTNSGAVFEVDEQKVA